jgi:hypothetical protein
VTERDALTVLKLRLELTGETYTPSTVTAWAQALADLELDVVGPAVHAIARSGERLTVPAIRNWLRDRRAAARRAEDMRSPTYACGCTTLSLCDEHRDRNLDALRAIRDEHGWPTP